MKLARKGEGMFARKRTDGTIGIYTNEKYNGRSHLAAIMPTQAAAEKIISHWKKDHEAAIARWENTLRQLGQTPYGLGIETGLDKTLVLTLNGRWTW